jgi:hypothetical protein
VKCRLVRTIKLSAVLLAAAAIGLLFSVLLPIPLPVFFILSLVGCLAWFGYCLMNLPAGAAIWLFIVGIIPICSGFLTRSSFTALLNSPVIISAQELANFPDAKVFDFTDARVATRFIASGSSSQSTRTGHTSMNVQVAPIIWNQWDKQEVKAWAVNPTRYTPKSWEEPNGAAVVNTVFHGTALLDRSAERGEFAVSESPIFLEWHPSLLALRTQKVKMLLLWLLIPHLLWWPVGLMTDWKAYDEEEAES